MDRANLKRTAQELLRLAESDSEVEKDKLRDRIQKLESENAEKRRKLEEAEATSDTLRKAKERLETLVEAMKKETAAIDDADLGDPRFGGKTISKIRGEPPDLSAIKSKCVGDLHARDNDTAKKMKDICCTALQEALADKVYTTAPGALVGADAHVTTKQVLSDVSARIKKKLGKEYKSNNYFFQILCGYGAEHYLDREHTIGLLKVRPPREEDAEKLPTFIFIRADQPAR
ncbi:unnamed protein product [Amoebophrya sp. A25]|nr:unnamed protein product [Amoebophrya sp. A25]|eukprot:GSA25T00004598001.1